MRLAYASVRHASQHWSETIAQRLAVEALIAEWSRRLDHDGGVGMEKLFAEQGVFAALGMEARGRDEIRATYERRRARGPRTARHLVTNLVIESLGEGRARATSIMVLFADDGEPPRPAHVPLVVADVVDECVREADGAWRLSSRTLRNIFEDGRDIALPLPGRGERA